MATSSGLQDSPSEATKLRILLVEDNADDAELCTLHLRKTNKDIHIDVVSTPDTFASRLHEDVYDVVLSDYALGSWTGLDVLNQLRSERQDIPFILVTGALGEERAVECMRNGVSDYVLKGRLERLPVAISKALDEKRLRREREHAELSLQESEAKFRALAESLPAATFIQQGTHCCYVNQAAEQITGYSREELEEMTFWQLVHPDSRKSAVGGAPNGGQSGVRYELKILTKENSTRWLDVTLTMFNHDGALASLITAFDITNRKLMEEGFAVAPGTDSLTGLPDYGRLADVFDAESKRSERTLRSCALLLLDLDLSKINAAHGPQAGDEALCRVARILLQCRASDMPARLRAGEFAVVLPDTSAEGAHTMGLRMATKIERDAKGPALYCRFGTAIFPSDGKNFNDILVMARRRLQRLDANSHEGDLNDAAPIVPGLTRVM
jgi:PAS domain S-box-containing protein/diguanylate cyclase (GGDEF)-like protein